MYPGVGGSIIYSENTEGSQLLNIHRFIFNTRKTDLLIGVLVIFPFHKIENNFFIRRGVPGALLSQSHQVRLEMEN